MPLYCPECSTSYDDESMEVCPNDGARLFAMEPRGDDPLLGAVIDERFRVDEVIGRGGMGTVYRGMQLSINRDVAIKVLRAELSDREVALERFFREAKVISALSHPNVVRLIDFGQDRNHDVLYLVMELVPGYNLAQILMHGRLRMSVALDVLYQCCGALTEPHAAGVIHRDLKPDNILLVPMSDGTVQAKVLDFGIARALEQNTQITATGMICGTPAYMAPEQAQNEDLDARTDLYALGVIFYEALSGWPPFTGTSSLQIMLKHIQEQPKPLRELLPPATLIPELEELTYRLMTKEREARPDSARAVRDIIDELHKSLDLSTVKVEADMTFDEIVDEWLLPKLPKGDEQKSGPTEVLRRETGMERYLTAVDGLDSDSYVTNDDFPTIPMEKEGSDAEADTEIDRVKVPTNSGGQQGWTPQDQGAIQRIKKTNDAPPVDVLGHTMDAPTPDPMKISRQTVVEDTPSTDETEPTTSRDKALRVKRGGESTDVGRPAAEPESTIEARRKDLLGGGVSATAVTALNVVLGFAALAAAAAVIYMVRDTVTEKEVTTAPSPAVIEKLDDEPPAAAEKPSTLGQVGIVRELAQNKLFLSRREAEIRAATEAALQKEAAATNVTRKPNSKRPKPATEPEPPRKSETKEEITEEKIFEGLRDH